MGGDGVSDVSAGAGKGVDGMVNGKVFNIGVYCKVGSLSGWQFCGVETRVNNVGRDWGFSEGDRGGVW